MKREHTIEQKGIQPVFFAPLTEDAVDVISGNAGTITGNNNATYSSNGLYFRKTTTNNGVQYITWNSNAHNIPAPSLQQSMTFLCDFNQASNSGHNAILIFQKNTSSRFVLLNYNWGPRMAVEKIGSGNQTINNGPNITLNTWYTNSGFSWDAENKTFSLIVNGAIYASISVTNLPDYTNPSVLLGWADGSGNYFNGYLRNVRFYDKVYTIEMNM